MLYFSGFTTALERNNNRGTKTYLLAAIYDTLTNTLNFYTHNKLKELVKKLRYKSSNPYSTDKDTGIQGLEKIHSEKNINFFIVTSDDKGNFTVGSNPIRHDYNTIYIEEPVNLGTLRKGTSFVYKNLAVKVMETTQNSNTQKLVDVSVAYNTTIKKNLSYFEFILQLKELTTCFEAHNSKMLLWKITPPVTDNIDTDMFLDLSIGKHKIYKLLNIPIQGAKYLRYTVTGIQECYVSMPTRTVEVLDLRNNETMRTSWILINSKVTDALSYFGTILISTTDENVIQGILNFFKTNKIHYLGAFFDMHEYQETAKKRKAAYALMHPNDRNVFFLASIINSD